MHKLLIQMLHKSVHIFIPSIQESTQQKVAGMHVLKKRCDEELFVCASRPKCKKNKKEKKRTHSVSVFYDSDLISG